MTDSQQTITDYYDTLAPAYDADRFANSYGRYIHRQEAFFLNRCLPEAPARVLSLGCGTGRFMEKATDGLDSSAAMIDQAKHKFPGKDFTIADAADTPYPAQQFDAAFCLHVLMHLTPALIHEILAEAHRIIKPGGTLVVDFPNSKRKKQHRGAIGDWHAANRFSMEEFGKAAFATGWGIKKHYGILLFPLHRIPVVLRSLLCPADTALCRTLLKKWASYQLAVLQRL